MTSDRETKVNDMDMVRVAVDAMGGDYAPVEPVKGAIEALNENERLYILLTGKKELIEKELSGYTYDRNRLEIVPASEVIETGEAPVMAVRQKKDCIGTRKAWDHEQEPAIVHRRLALTPNATRERVNVEILHRAILSSGANGLRTSEQASERRTSIPDASSIRSSQASPDTSPTSSSIRPAQLRDSASPLMSNTKP